MIMEPSIEKYIVEYDEMKIFNSMRIINVKYQPINYKSLLIVKYILLVFIGTVWLTITITIDSDV